MKGKKVAKSGFERTGILESVKLDKSVVDLVRGNKEVTRLPIKDFIESAIIEKLKLNK